MNTLRRIGAYCTLALLLAGLASIHYLPSPDINWLGWRNMSWQEGLTWYIAASLLITFGLGMTDEGLHQPADQTDAVEALVRWLLSPTILAYLIVYALGWATLQPYKNGSRWWHRHRYDKRIRAGKNGITGKAWR